MKRLPGWIGLLLIAWDASNAGGQGTTVQLPRYTYFSAGTTVSVPDRGKAYLGGVNRARSASNEFGTPLLPLRNRAFGSERRAAGTSVSVYIHDFQAMDEYLLGPAFVSGRTSPVSGDPRRALADDPRGALASLEEIIAQRRREQEARQAEAEDFVERAQAAEEAGKANVARIYYQMAARRADGSLKQHVLAKLDCLGRAQAATVARRQR